MHEAHDRQHHTADAQRAPRAEGSTYRDRSSVGVVLLGGDARSEVAALPHGVVVALGLDEVALVRGENASPTQVEGLLFVLCGIHPVHHGEVIGPTL